MHFVMSTRIAFVVAMIVLLSLAEPGYDRKNSLTTFCRNSGVSCGSKPLIGSPPSWASAGEGANIAFSRATVVLHPGRHHRTLDQISLIDFHVRRFHHRDPAVLVRVIRNQARILQHVVVDCHNYAFNGREQIHAGVATGQA